MILFVKNWDDELNQDGVRPDSVRFTLLANGVPVAAQDLSAEDAMSGDGAIWGTGFSELPKYQDGKVIDYQIIEESIDHYTSNTRIYTVDDLNEDDNDKILRDFSDLLPEGVELPERGFMMIQITNKHVPEVKDVTVNKVWVDEDDADGIRPESVEVKLLADGEVVKVDGEEVKATLDASNGWTYTFHGVPVYKNETTTDEESGTSATVNGKKINYTVEETATDIINGDKATGYQPSYTNLSGEGGFITVTNTHEVKRVNHTVTVQWDDNDNQDGLRPEYVNVFLTKDGVKLEGSDVTLSPANGWTHTWEGLPAGVYSTGMMEGQSVFARAANFVMGLLGVNRSEATFAADEITPLDPSVYEKVSVTTEGDTTTIVNQYTPKTIDVEGHKIWDDASNQDGKRPESITLNLYANGDLVTTQELTAEAATDEKGDVWAYKFEGMPRYIDGQLVEYLVTEEPVENYSLRIEGYDLINTYTPGKTFVTVIKLWDDDRNRDGIRPENVIVRLLANGEEINRASISSASGWFTIFTDLDLMKDGQEIEYTVTEDAVEGYEAEITGDRATGFTVKNTHVPELINVPVTKTWDDNNNCKKFRPNSITVHLIVNGVVVDTHVLTADEDWKTVFENVPKYSAGQEVSYVISEDAVPGYITTVSGYDITNTLRPNPCASGCGTSKPESTTVRTTGSPTGDMNAAHFTIYILMMFCAAGMIAIFATLRKKQVACRQKKNR